MALRALRGIAASSLVGLVGLVGYEGLRSAGFAFRWEVDDPWGASSARGEASRPRGPASPAVGAGASGRPAREATRPTHSEVADGGGERVTDLALEAPSSTAGPAASGESARIDFETFGDGGAFCANCPVSDQWSRQGLILSFRSWSAGSTEPYVLDARNFLPPNSSTHALGPALSGERGLEVGVTRLDFPGRPRTVAFTLYGPDLIGSLSVTAWSAGERLPPTAIFRALEATYHPAERGLFRAERIRVEAPLGVDRISIDGWGPPGHVLLIDNLAIDP